MRVALAVLLFASIYCLHAQEPVRRVADSRAEQVAQAKLDAISAVIKGQCVDGETGKPLPGCKIALRVWGSRGKDELPVELTKPDPVVSDGEGYFAMRVLARERWQVGLDISLLLQGDAGISIGSVTAANGLGHSVRWTQTIQYAAHLLPMVVQGADLRCEIGVLRAKRLEVDLTALKLPEEFREECLRPFLLRPPLSAGTR